jgi:hypothetical protein
MMNATQIGRDIEVKIEWREGANLRGRYTTLGEIESWPGLPAWTALTADTSNGRVTHCEPIDPVAPTVIYLPDGSWLAGDIADFLSVVRAIDSGESPQSIFDRWL